MSKKKRSGKERRDEYGRIIKKARSERGRNWLVPVDNKKDLRQIPIYDPDGGEKIISVTFDREETGGEEIPVYGAKKKKGELLHTTSLWVSALSLAVATTMAVTAVILTVGDRENKDTDAEQVFSDGKVIYVHKYDGEGGILAAPELYDNCKNSVVSILCRSAGKEKIGSGFVISEDGYIATVAHVLDDGADIFAVDCDGTKHGARVVCKDPVSDVALLKISADDKRLSPVSFGESKKLLVGEKIYAIGTPASLDYAGTLSSGEVTYVDRRVKVYGEDGAFQKRMTVIQTNAELNSGNSGCPIFDEYGRVVGMVTSKLGSGYDGIGFAIPSDGLAAALTDMKNGTFSEESRKGIADLAPDLGVKGRTVATGDSYGFCTDSFYECGSNVSLFLKAGDVIMEIDGSPVRTERDIYNVINKKVAADTAELTVLRAGQRLRYEIRLGEKK